MFAESNLNIASWSLASFKPREGFFYGAASRWLFYIIFAVILLLAIIIVLLLINQFYRIKLEKDLRKFSKTVEQSPLSVIITDLEGTIEYVNHSFERITGYQAEEVIGENPSLLKTNEHSDAFYQELWEAITAGYTWEGEFYNQKKNGECYWEEAKITPLVDKNNRIEAFIAIKEDITEEKQLKEKLEFFAERDELTNLYNRRIGTKLIKEHKREADKTNGSFSLAFVDINNLKVVNDVYGHEVGDELIVTVVETIKENIRSSDFIARFGGDEFVIIFEDARANDAKTKLENIQAEFEKINQREDYQYQVSISYGVEEYFKDREISVDELISMADGKMYKFKQKYKEEHDLPIR
ncbi:sensor domain-containing diguanylate cyclase [Halanaerobacter jeridensis]|uniref:Diguanylate cyclase (GGDEF)-like protein/PAS domain S-box-containing protein n=1 Tax=Halanaerobacter jeridensis TaxID=706427 RepID=A0A938XNN6_9FIRM|nr:GGDEF domain-containing protein [Halanaerobacter jeridensis]MBM7555717.1 diguanylate cyclase (GGDEF)-like protein/PAS domain S-box-containing protein [Halanaerobacter jeridensis]